jgi:hypothetical protein
MSRAEERKILRISTLEESCSRVYTSEFWIPWIYGCVAATQ